MSEYGSREWADVEAYPLPALIRATLEDLDNAAYIVLGRYLVEQGWEIERLNQRTCHLRECLREIAPLVLSANSAEERYPLAINECKALSGDGEGE